MAWIGRKVSGGNLCICAKISKIKDGKKIWIQWYKSLGVKTLSKKEKHQILQKYSRERLLKK